MFTKTRIVLIWLVLATLNSFFPTRNINHLVTLHARVR